MDPKPTFLNGQKQYDHKIGKNQGMATNIFAHLKGRRSVGIISKLPEKGLIEMAHPVGVIRCVLTLFFPVYSAGAEAAQLVRLLPFSSSVIARAFF